MQEIIRRYIREIINEELERSDYKTWKRQNVTYRGMKEIGQPNNVYGSLGAGLYSTPLSNKSMSKEYGKVYFALNARPKNPKILNSINDWEIFLYNQLIFPFSKAQGKEYPDKRDFSSKTTIEAEMQKLGYDGVVIKGREMVNYRPGDDVMYFGTERELMDYYEDNVA